ncbi:hypothetical protein [Pseudobacteroides cellulosolvens]|uniref:Uncharacterized protein n=1 Tax=Pseudobacteroides cellulosolvens ATCC 35603 = DSM 2933 TaxID=398512 RepID=A0A0L6JTU4_9FIRM|nr:hypothetical protein [Pseudobacteroides cellulosolvens]KNY29218.1 hypothetical protein Bccel_4492 [Pseudobacteroides cellulosolvens ATCC 35603 = DSM 2933]
MIVEYIKYTFKKNLFKTYSCAIIEFIDAKYRDILDIPEFKEKEANDAIKLFISNFSRLKECDKILVCTKNNKGNFVVEKYPFANEEMNDHDDVFKEIIRYIANKYIRKTENINIIYGTRSINVKIMSRTEFLDMENGKKSEIISPVGKMESGQIKSGYGQINIKKDNGHDKVK